MNILSQQGTDRFTRVGNKFLVPYPWAQRALLLFPLLAVAGPFASFQPGAAGFPYFYRILWVLCLVVAVPLFLLEARRRTIPMLYTVMVAAWVVWAPISLMWSPAPATGRTEVIAGTAAMAGSWVVLILTRGTSRSLRYLRWGWLGAFAVSMVVVIGEFFTGRHLGELTGTWNWVYSAYSVAGLDTNPNGLSNFCIAAVAVTCAQILRDIDTRRKARVAIEAYENDRRQPADIDGPPAEVPGSARPSLAAKVRLVILVIGLATASFAVYLTGSRAGILALMMLLLMAVLFCFPRRALLIVPVALLAVTALTYTLPKTDLNTIRTKAVVEQATRKRTGYQDGISDAQKQADMASADQLRKDLSLLGLRYVAQHPLHGNGAGSALTLVEKDPDYQPGVPREKKHILNLHNTYLEIGVNYGLIGLLPILAVPCWALFVFLRPRHLRRFWPDPVVYEGLGILLALAVSSVITSTSIGTPSFWLLAAYAAALAWNYGDATRAATARHDEAPITAPADMPSGR